MDEHDLILNPNPDNKPKEKLRFKPKTTEPPAEPAPGSTEPPASAETAFTPRDTYSQETPPASTGTVFTPRDSFSGTTFTPRDTYSQETPPASTGTVFTPRDSFSETTFTPRDTYSQETPPASTGTVFTPRDSYSQETPPASTGTVFTPRDSAPSGNPGGFRPVSGYGNDEEYSDTARYKGSNDGGYDYGYDFGYDKKTAPPNNYGEGNRGQYGGQYVGANQRQYGGQYGGPNQGQYGGQYGGANRGQYGGQYGGPYQRDTYREPVQQHNIEDGNEARLALIMGIVSLIGGTIAGVLGVGGLYCSFVVFILPFFGLARSIRVIKKDKRMALGYVALGINCMALTPAIIAILILILAGVSYAVR